MYLFSVVLLVGLLLAVFLFFYAIYEVLWDALKMPIRKIRMRSVVPKRIYLFIRNVILQGKLFKDKGGGIMHALMFWGFLAFAAYSSEFFVRGIDPSASLFSPGLLENVIFFTVDIFAIVVIADVIYAVVRRWVIKIPRYKGHNGFEAAFILALIGGLMVTYYILGVIRLDGISAGYPGSIMEGLAPGVTPITNFFASVFPKIGHTAGLYLYWITWSIHASIFLVFLVYVPRSKHLHLFAAPLNVLLTKDDQPAKLTPIDFDKETRFGATDARDFTWKDYLDFDSCTECGRCTANCPANLTGKTLSPREIIWDLREVVMKEGKELRKNHDDVATSSVFTKVIGEPILEEDLWSCTTCMACVEQCPVMIDHVPKIVDMRRSLVLNEGKAPREVLDFQRNMESYGAPWVVDPSTRGDWANGLDVVDLSKTPDAKFDVLYWVGCVASYDRRNQEIARSIVKILKVAGISFAILGSQEKCSGDPARRTGNEYLAQILIKQNIETFKEKRVQKVITGCAHCFNSLKNEYADFGIELEVHHHTEFINNLLASGKIKIKQLDRDLIEKYTYHDACYLGRYNRIFEEPRNVLTEFAENYEEMEMNKTKGLCCGAGGGRLWMEENVGQKVSHKRIEMADKVNATTVVTACPYCMTMLDDARKVTNREEKMKITDISELVAERLDTSGGIKEQ